MAEIRAVTAEFLSVPNRKQNPAYRTGGTIHEEAAPKRVRLFLFQKECERTITINRSKNR
jgi:hypothetical protein